MKKLIFAILNVDEDVIHTFESKKERNIVYVSFFRILLSSIFIFLICLYACNTIPALEGTYAWIVASIVTSIIFAFDSLIIGKEWESPQGLGWANALRKLLIIPRLLLSIGIVLPIATIAELAIQKEAITVVLNEEVKEHNRKSGYTQKFGILKDKQEKEIDSLKSGVRLLEDGIKARENGNLQENLRFLSESTQNSRSSIDRLTKNMEDSKILERNLTDELIEKEQTLNEIKKKIQGYQNLMHEEVNNIEKCKTPGAIKCRGRNWNINNNKKRVLERQREEIAPQVSEIKISLEKVNEDIGRRNEELFLVEGKYRKSNAELIGIDNNSKTLNELKDELLLKVQKLDGIRGQHRVDFEAFKKQQSSGGLYRDAQDYDFNMLHGGLQTLHADPLRGEGAKRFSLGLFIFIVFLETSAVIGVFFFSPFSEYRSKMYLKKKTVSLNEKVEYDASTHYGERDFLQIIADVEEQKAKINRDIFNAKMRDENTKDLQEMIRKTKSSIYNDENFDEV